MCGFLKDTPIHYITLKEYEQQGQEETEKALNELRSAYLNPALNPYGTILKLSNAGRNRSVFHIIKTYKNGFQRPP